MNGNAETLTQSESLFIHCLNLFCLPVSSIRTYPHLTLVIHNFKDCPRRIRSALPSHRRLQANLNRSPTPLLRHALPMAPRISTHKHSARPVNRHSRISRRHCRNSRQTTGQRSQFRSPKSKNSTSHLLSFRLAACRSAICFNLRRSRRRRQHSSCRLMHHRLNRACLWRCSGRLDLDLRCPNSESLLQLRCRLRLA